MPDGITPWMDESV